MWCGGVCVGGGGVWMGSALVAFQALLKIIPRNNFTGGRAVLVTAWSKQMNAPWRRGSRADRQALPPCDSHLHGRGSVGDGVGPGRELHPLSGGNGGEGTAPCRGRHVKSGGVRAQAAWIQLFAEKC